MLIKNVNISMNYSIQLLKKFKTNSYEFKEFYTTGILNNINHKIIITPNLIKNPDFDLGDTLFNSSYDKLPDMPGNLTPVTNGWRRIGLSNHILKKDWVAKGYNKTGNYFLLDGAATSNNIVWQQTVRVEPFKKYYLNLYLCTLSLDSTIKTYSKWMFAAIEVTINGKKVCGDLAPEKQNEWKKIGGFWESKDYRTATITIRNLNTSALYNDFGIDHLNFQQVTEKQSNNKRSAYTNAKIYNDTLEDKQLFEYLFRNELNYNQIENLTYNCHFLSTTLVKDFFEKNGTGISDMDLEKKYYEIFNETKEHYITTSIYNIGNTQLVFVSIFNTNNWILNKIKLPITAFLLMLLLAIGVLYTAYNWQHSQNQKFSQKSEMLNLIAHELKTPISAISIALETLEKYQPLFDKEKSNIYLKESRLQSSRLQDLIESVLRTLESPAKIDVLNIEKIQIDELIAYCIDLFTLNNKNISINYFNKSGLKFIKSDKLHLINVISNILDNAIKYSTKTPNIEIILTTTNKYFTISIKDNGIGIAERYKQRIFEPFFREPSPIINNIKGFGLGLAYCKRIIQLQKGSIIYESKQGSGSVFIINLPL